MKKIITILSASLLMFAFVTSVSAAASNWNVSGTWMAEHEFGGNTYSHVNNIVQALDGSLTGTGGWDGKQNGIPVGTPNTWEITNGSVSNNNVQFNYKYTTVETCALNGSIDAVINADGSMTGTWHDDCDTGRTGAWTVPAGSAVYLRTAKITSPTSGEEVSGMVSFDAILIDKDGDDSVQWAVRQGTCTAGIGTVFGNVDGKSDTYTWDHVNFHASADTSSWAPGNYCFVFNPTESAGDIAIRETREFILKDTVAPLVTIESPSEGDVVSGTVEIYGTVVENYMLSHYNISVYPGDADFNDFSKRIAQATIYRTTGFSNELIFAWDSTGFEDGEYLIRLAARDAAGNRSYDGNAYLGGDDSQHVIRVTVNNIPDLIGPPTDKNECKKDGWKIFDNPSFKNQGDCVSYVQSNGNAIGNKNK